MKECIVELKEKIIGLLEEIEVLKRETIAIKEEVTNLKAEYAVLMRKLAKHAAMKKLYVMAIMLSWILLTIMIVF